MVSREQVLSSLWTDVCTVTVRQKVKDSETKITGFKEVTLLDDVPCKLSFGTAYPAGGDSVSMAEQPVKLFLSKDVEIPAGSKIMVTRGERTFVYSNSGEPLIFSCHQEIALTKWRAWT